MDEKKAMSEWMKVMLGEIASKQDAQREARKEHERRRAARDDEQGRKPGQEHDPAEG